MYSIGQHVRRRTYNNKYIEYIQIYILQAMYRVVFKRDRRVYSFQNQISHEFVYLVIHFYTYRWSSAMRIPIHTVLKVLYAIYTTNTYINIFLFFFSQTRSKWMKEPKNDKKRKMCTHKLLAFIVYRYFQFVFSFFVVIGASTNMSTVSLLGFRLNSYAHDLPNSTIEIMK